VSVFVAKIINGGTNACDHAKKIEKDHAAWLSSTITINLNKRPHISQAEPATS